MGKFVPFILILFVSDFLLMISGCRNSIETPDKNQIESKAEITTETTNPLFVKFRSFQNIDSTWGYTVLVNGRPYIHYSRIPYKNNGFATKHDAEIVAGILVKMIQNGEMTPKLNKKIIDSIELQMKHPK